MSVRVERPSTFTEIIEIIEDLRKKADGTLWYRGCGQADHKLVPTLFRHPKTKTVSEIAILETQLLTRFRQRSIPFHDRPLTDDWDALFFMQHYGVPTRLLDWTENPFVSLFFTVTSASYKLTTNGTQKFTAPAALWVLNPVKWNRHSLKHQAFDGGVLVPGDDALKGYRPVPSYAGMNNHPVALYGAHNSPRIVAQRGVFTIFGKNTAPMDKIFMTEKFPDDSIVKIVLGPNAIKRIKTSIFGHGITESVVYPDLNGLAKEIRRTFGFEV
jgi:hypothetical protein